MSGIIGTVRSVSNVAGAAGRLVNDISSLFSGDLPPAAALADCWTGPYCAAIVGAFTLALDRSSAWFSLMAWSAY